MVSLVFLLAMRTGIFAEERFLGRLLDHWSADAEEFVRGKLLHLITFHMTRVAERNSATPVHVAQVKTVAGVVRTTGLAIIWVIAGLQILDTLGVNLAPLLASAGIAGIALGLAAQNIVRDMLNGMLILIEDQFNVGDTVRIAGVAGTVEAMTLRKTTVRDADGTLYIIPNSQITTVANLSVGYSVATVNVSVDFSANPDRVLELLKGIAMEIRGSEEFREVFVADPQILGVDAIKGSELIFPVVFKTLATKQYAPVREFRRRVRLALEEQALLPGDPNRVFLGTRDQGPGTRDFRAAAEGAQQHDPTTLKPQEGNPFGSQ
jgi:small conductance mechanosensitive channel